MGIFKKEPKELKTLNADSVLEFIQSKGMPARKDSDESIVFKLNNEEYSINVKNRRFSLSRTYNLNDDVSDVVLMRANNETMSERYCLKVCINIYREQDEDGNAIHDTVLGRTLVFSCESLCDSFDEFKRQYEWCIYALTDGISYHRSVYGRVLLEMSDETNRTNKIGFKSNAYEERPSDTAATSVCRKIGFR